VADLTHLSADEEAALKALDAKYQYVRDTAVLVAHGSSSGFLCWGPGGAGKSFQITDVLQKYDKEFVHLNTRLTTPKFAKTLSDHPRGLFLVEDLEDIFTERASMALLRSAFWGQEDEHGKMVRPITYQTGSEDWCFDFNFEGGIIATMNSIPDEYPELKALQTRIDVYHLETEPAELFALGHRIALKGYKPAKLAADVTTQVWDFWRQHWPSERSPDLRILPRIWRKYPEILRLKLKTTCEDTLIKMIHQGDTVASRPMSEEERLDKAARLAARLHAKHGKDRRRLLAEWTKLTVGLGRTVTDPLGERAYYKALDRAKEL
jgi:hypothetical protein